MYTLTALFLGLLLAVMIFINGQLALAVGVFQAGALAHAIGALFALVACLLTRQKPLPRTRSPWWFYLGGVIGVTMTIFNNLAFGRISLTSIIALGLLGQTAASLLIDATGWLGMTRRPFRKSTLVGLAFCLAGIALMLDRTVAGTAPAVWLSLAAGVAVVLSRSINARLAEGVGALPGSFINHLAGLPVTLLLVAASREGLPLFPALTLGRSWIYLGGVLGVGVVVLFNILVPRISQFSLTVLVFVGQVLAGVLLDLLQGHFKADASFFGGLLIAAGIALNLAIEYFSGKKPAGEAPDPNQGSP